ncbi:SURF1 family protein [Neorhizobium sp. NCHU2750]|uniref:SURF1 family protein n=1 Tax=Neorhizobium sp. NCHU2750 TaxID=1825976 RepID=UPI000E711C44|nr:surfeit locus 1 family protein [Neorhizobium sp. NCHU2750]
METPVKSYLGFRAFLLFLTIVFTALGIWQIQRLFWKLDLIARVDARVHAQASAPPSPTQWTSTNPADAEYRHVTVSGHFDHSRETLVQAVTELGPGFWVITPLTETDGTVVLINRGFVPPDHRDPSTRSEGEIGGNITVTGLLRLSEPGGAFLRSNKPATNSWYSRDVAAIGENKGLANVVPYFIDADATPNPGGYPVGGLTVVHFRNSHLAYILTWFSLAIMSLVAMITLPRLMRRGD